ncbi:MAG: TIGR03915 family putative DNA repair protein [Bacteroidales bacterium]|jgi:probable DNA metabolism protein|nr:TIGR03915 family putative DNA repair protein [Bacteroidales bacterium]
MNLFIYDQTFEGLLTAIYDALELNVKPDRIVGANNFQDDLFAAKYEVITDTGKFDALWNEIKRKSSGQNCQRIFKAFLSELPGIEILIYNYIQRIIESEANVELDFGDDVVLKINTIQKKVGRESHRVLMFVRFQKTIDDIFYASFDPKYNVIPLTVNHFKSRFADQKWVIFDTRRKYGYYYDLQTVREVTIGKNKVNDQTGKVDPEILHVSEKLFQKLWKNYYDSITIKERKNLKVHMQFLPKRFWKFLPEKEPRHQSRRSKVVK